MTNNQPMETRHESTICPVRYPSECAYVRLLILIRLNYAKYPCSKGTPILLKVNITVELPLTL